MNLSKRMYRAITGQNVVLAMYPAAVAGAGTAPIGTVVADGGANTFAASTEFIAAGVIATEYWFCQVQIGAASVAETYVCDVMNPNTTTSIYSFRCGVTAVTANLAAFGPPFPIRCAPGTTIGARTASNSGGDSLTLSLLLATGL